VRVHEPLSLMDLLDAGSCTHTWPLPQALRALQASGRGAAVLLNAGDDATMSIAQRMLPGTTPPRARTPMDLRTYGIGAQILRDLGVARMTLLGQPRPMPSMTGYSLEVLGYRAAPNGEVEPVAKIGEPR
jgi:3,4-dihydroxy 2-butanone 4-phosphate synthase / GTP cyclohydrolase II